VIGLRGEKLLVDVDYPIARGDGIVLEGNRAKGEEVGGRIYEVLVDGRSVEHPAKGRVEWLFQRGLLKNVKVHPGQAIWQTDDPQLSRILKATYTGKSPHYRRPIDIEVEAVQGQPLRMVVRCESQALTIETTEELAVANKHSIDETTLREQLGRLGGSPYFLRSLTANISGNPMIPFSVLGKLRRDLLEELTELHSRRVSFPCSPEKVTERMLGKALLQETLATTSTLHVLCRSLSQLEMVLADGIRDTYVDFHDIRQYREAVEMAHRAGASIALASLRIQKPGETGLFLAMAKHPADGWLVRNLAALRFAQEHKIPVVGDFSLNVTNPLTAEWLVGQGLRRCTASYDLNRDQLMELVESIPKAWLEVVIHQHIPMFHMEHCVFCTVLSPGTNKSNCGRPCDRHLVQLEDRIGVKHVLHADIGCRNTLYNGVAQSGAEAVPKLLNRGIRHFRIELLQDSSPEQTQKLIRLYRELIDGRIAGSEVWKSLKADNRVGVTRGTLEHPRNPLAIL
jgi:putative protease